MVGAANSINVISMNVLFFQYDFLNFYNYKFFISTKW